MSPKLVFDDGLAVDAVSDGTAHSNVVEEVVFEVEGQIGVFERLIGLDLQSLRIADDRQHHRRDGILDEIGRPAQQCQKSRVAVLDDLEDEFVDLRGPLEVAIEAPEDVSMVALSGDECEGAGTDGLRTLFVAGTDVFGDDAERETRQKGSVGLLELEDEALLVDPLEGSDAPLGPGVGTPDELAVELHQRIADVFGRHRMTVVEVDVLAEGHLVAGGGGLVDRCCQFQLRFARARIDRDEPGVEQSDQLGTGVARDEARVQPARAGPHQYDETLVAPFVAAARRESSETEDEREHEWAERTSRHLEHASHQRGNDGEGHHATVTSSQR